MGACLARPPFLSPETKRGHPGGRHWVMEPGGGSSLHKTPPPPPLFFLFPPAEEVEERVNYITSRGGSRTAPTHNDSAVLPDSGHVRTRIEKKSEGML